MSLVTFQVRGSIDTPYSLEIHCGEDMKVIGRRSVAPILKLMIDSMWYVAIVAFGGALIFFMWAFFLSGPSYEIHGWPIDFDPSVETSGIRPVGGNVEVLEIVIDKAEIGFRTSGDWRPKVIRLASLIVGGCLVLLILYNLRRLIASIVNGNPFVKENVARFRKVALLFIAITVFEVIRGTLIGAYLRSRFATGNLNNPFTPLELEAFGDFIGSFNWHLIFIALTMLVLGEIFRLGLEYKEDSQSIV